MPDSIPLWFVSLYCVVWLGVARFAVGVWRVNRRERTRKEMLARLGRWKDC